MSNQKMVVIDVRWLTATLATFDEVTQAKLMEAAREHTAEHCQSGAVPRNVISYMYQAFRQIDEDEYGPGAKVMRIHSAPYSVIPEFVKCVRDMCDDPNTVEVSHDK